MILLGDLILHFLRLCSKSIRKRKKNSRLTFEYSLYRHHNIYRNMRFLIPYMDATWRSLEVDTQEKMTSVVKMTQVCSSLCIDLHQLALLLLYALFYEPGYETKSCHV